MNRPDWKDAPEWANYLAMDYDALWHWYEEEPRLDTNYLEIWWSSGRELVAYEFSITSDDISYSAEDTLEKRP